MNGAAASLAYPARPPRPSLNRAKSSDDPSTTRVAHTLTACTRCRQRKTRCDPGLPRCGPCERNNAVCEYWDPTKRCSVKRDYVVWLQQRVNELEKEMDRLDTDDPADDPEIMIRGAAAVRVQDADESKYLGPASGTQITRLVMQLAKLFSDSKTIKDIVPDASTRRAQELYAVEAAKPTSKVYPLVSSVAAEELPNPELTTLLFQLYCLKVQPMYPVLHEPTLAAYIEAAQNGTADPHQNFITRMVLAISLQRMSAQYAGLADSYYLAALRYMEAVVSARTLETLQAYALIAEYSLLTPTRTAIYYICGLAIRLVQELGINEEATLVRGEDGNRADPLTIDMRRRVFWCIFAMEAGLAHALGRPVSLATGRDHIDVRFFELCDDKYITPQGVLPEARTVLKKWTAMHFFKMRLIQLEIRRKLYQRKRPTPKHDQDPWFEDVTARLDAWRDASPVDDAGAGLNKVWFIGRYNTIVALLYRPCPQIPRPTSMGALKCFEAARYNIYMFQEQIKRDSVMMTWIFTQALFMAINTMLWSLSYEEVRKNNPKPEVERHLAVGLKTVVASSDRWPGVASAHALYVHIIAAILKVYDKTGDVNMPITPSDHASPTTSGSRRSRTTSPAVVSANGKSSTPSDASPYSYFSVNAERSSTRMSYVETPSPLQHGATVTQATDGSTIKSESRDMVQIRGQSTDHDAASLLDSTHFQAQSLPAGFVDFANMTWEPVHPYRDGSTFSPAYDPYAMPMNNHFSSDPSSGSRVHGNRFHNYPPELQQQASAVLNPEYWNQSVGASQGVGLNFDQQHALMQDLETTGMGTIEMMIEGANKVWNPQRSDQ